MPSRFVLGSCDSWAQTQSSSHSIASLIFLLVGLLGIVGQWEGAEWWAVQRNNHCISFCKKSYSVSGLPVERERSDPFSWDMAQTSFPNMQLARWHSRSTIYSLLTVLLHLLGYVHFFLPCLWHLKHFKSLCLRVISISNKRTSHLQYFYN